MSPVISICHATARPNGWPAAWTAWRERHSGIYSYEYILCMDEAQAESLPSWESGTCRTVVNRARPCATDAFNCAARASTGEILFLASDDCFPPASWDRELVEASRQAASRDFVIWVSTGCDNDCRLILVPILSRERFLRYGYALHPDYPTVYADNEFTEVAERDGVIIDMRRKIFFDHRHFTRPDGLPFDEVYARQNHPEQYRRGWQTLNRRRALGFPAASVLEAAQ